MENTLNPASVGSLAGVEAKQVASPIQEQHADLEIALENLHNNISKLENKLVSVSNSLPSGERKAVELFGSSVHQFLQDKVNSVHIAADRIENIISNLEI